MIYEDWDREVNELKLFVNVEFWIYDLKSDE